MNWWKYSRLAFEPWLGSLLGALLLTSCGQARPDVSTSNGGGVGHVSDAGVSSEPQASTDALDASPAGDTSQTRGARPDGGGVTDVPTAPSGSEPDLDFNGAPSRSNYVRLTHVQWENSVVATLRLSEPTGYLERLLPDVAARYTNNETVLVVSDGLVEDYQAAAADVASRVANDAAALNRVSASREPEAFIAEVGRRFYRRPLTSEERAKYLDLYETGASLATAEQDAFTAGAQLLLEVWMQTPSFLYRAQHSDGPLDSYEVATRLALLLTDTTPLDDLLAAADTGSLATAEGVASAAKDLLATLPARLVFRRFHDETFLLGRLRTHQVDAAFGLASDLEAQLLEAAHHFSDRQVGEGYGLREMLLSEVGFVNAGLAALYGVAAPASDAFEAVPLGPARRGWFAQLPFLMLDSVNDTPDAFRRGAMFTNYVLCQALPDHPGNLPVPPAPEGQNLTNRQYSNQLVAAPECQACHRYIDPFGFAFENFDGLGRERSLDHGLAVDTTASYPFATNSEFADSTELMALLAESPLAHACYSKQLTEFALGRSLDAADAALVADLQALSLDGNESLTGLVTALVSSETFRSAGGSL